MSAFDNLPKLMDADVLNKRVLVRADLDVDISKSNELLRLSTLLPTLKFLSEKNCIITIIGHRGRPEGKVDETLSLKPIEEKLMELAGGIKFNVLENLRFEPGEESNDPAFAQKLATNQDFYVNEAFGVSHREHASIVGLPKILPHAMGLRFADEIENISKVRNTTQRPLMIIISGVKEDKTKYIPALEKFCDKVLVGGKLPDYLESDRSVRDFKDSEKVIIANLVMDKEDITLHSIERFKSEISKAKTIILAGAIGKYEDPGHMQGTKEVFTAVARTDAFKLAGGGDTECVIGMLGLVNNFDWISVGGGAMLELLANGSLPGIEALR